MAKITKIMKFGGSSVGSADRIKNVCRIIHNSALSQSKGDKIAVVVSAMQGVTDKLLVLDFAWVKEKHLAAAKELRVSSPIILLNELENIIKGIKLIGDASPMVLDLVASFGERLSAELIASYFKKSQAVDARKLVKTDDNFQNAAVDFSKTNVKIRNYFRKLPQGIIPIITGFIGSDDKERTTTLGRGGSDYTAAIFGAALNCDVIEIWTDVDGVMSADPRIVPEAVTLPQISYEEAFEMAYFGAKVIYPPTMLPAIKKNIPIVIKNTFNPEYSGTVICKKSKTGSSLVKNFSTIDDVSLINIGGMNLAGVPGTAERVFRVIANKKINVILISQASSEYTICFVVKNADAVKALSALNKEFESEIRDKKMAVEKKDDHSVIAVVGEKMRGIPGIAGRIFGVLGQNKINIFAIAQGSSEKNVSLVVNRGDKDNAIRFLHQEFFSPSRDAEVFLIGKGVVGSALLKQAKNRSGFKICAVADSKQMRFDGKGFETMNLKEYIRKAAKRQAKTKILVDCTASETIAKSYEDFAKKGFHIVTPNKKANVLPIKKYQSLREILAANKKYFYYDANVGAGLPVIETIKNLLATGDKINKIEGIFSGTLSYLFNNFDGKQKFSALVAEAKQRGYTEPDPREDLSGMDVGRKLLILAREVGQILELSDVKLENLADYDDAYFAGRLKKARAKKNVLRYVGSIKNGRLAACLKEVGVSEPLANTSGTDNIIAIYTKNYKNPLVIKGPGAGAEVTAAAVLKGILKIIHEI